MAIAWILAVAAAIAVTAAIYIWTAGISKKLEERTARHQADAEREITDAARHENELHRQRFAEVWNWQTGQPPGDERAESPGGSASGRAHPGHTAAARTARPRPPACTAPT